VHNLLRPPNRLPLHCFTLILASKLMETFAIGRLRANVISSSTNLWWNVKSVMCCVLSLQQKRCIAWGMTFNLKTMRTPLILDSDPNHPNTEEAVARTLTVPDQICVRRIDGNSSILYSVESKPPHKLTMNYLRSGLREMNFSPEVV
jgi:hypothetical protein